MNEDSLIGHMGLTWHVPVPKTAKDLVEFIEVVTQNVALRQDIPVDNLKMELESDGELIRIGENEGLEKMDEIVKDWNESGHKVEGESNRSP